jgi:hypothetical protein
MSRFGAWVLVIYALAVTGFAGYQYEVIEHLHWVIRILLAGSPQ